MDLNNANVHANKRRRTNDLVDLVAVDINVWGLLADEHAMAILSWCTPADLATLSAVDWRLRRLALDERLWKDIYDTAFPSCGRGCIATLGKSVAGLDIAALVDRGLDLMLDPTKTTTGCVLPLPESVSGLGQIHNPALLSCHHHWPDVITARGYRWAYAVATVSRPRLFGPHLDGTPPRLVGRSCSLNTIYRGDLADGRRDTHVAHGYATADAIQFLPPGSTTDRTIVAHSPSGQWAHGRLAGRAVAWCSPRDCDPRPPTDYRNQWVGFYQGPWAGGCPHGIGILIGPDYKYPQPSCHAPSVVGCGNREWSVVAHKDHPNAGVGTGGGMGDRGATMGVVRTVDGTVAFAGEVSRFQPVAGRLMAQDGMAVYDGDVCATDRKKRKGRLFFVDGRTIDLAGWGGELNRGTPPEFKYGRGAATILVTYVNGDMVRWYGNPASLIEFVCADGRVYQPPLGWDTAACRSSSSHADSSARDQSARLLIQNTPFALPKGRDILLAHDHIRDLVFWPRLASSDDSLAYAAFLDHMAVHHGPLWVRCRAAVRLLWGLDSVPSDVTNP
ncbi:F-box domain containing protein [Pandoravirus quercus]|uniref:F-box domain containing protein n=1 Tax=Pandoravirus quercus TaxID=2107709 RepID=A0A2U7U9G3_9VIRU|nr:F-box domain containing protein [Pandoravirus quercus]AVK75025.1 F-box domain containing protein [Pandoravirus quercus]